MKSLEIDKLDQFVYGIAPKPVECGRGVQIGAGTVVPEINFTLPAMLINDETWKDVLDNYTDMIDHVLQRTVKLKEKQLIVEFETLPDMTIHPRWGLEITRLLVKKLQECYDKHGLRNALRLTINDIREFERPPLLRRGKYWEAMQVFLDQAAAAGADLIAIESTGGKEVCDEALISCDLRTVVFALGILGARDMEFLWKEIVGRCEGTKMVPSGDSACGFANTAMVLADQNMIPQIFAALVRVASVPRSLVAVTMGAKGPTKDCAYEGPFIKAISGVPISMEGRSAACAHLSPVGNVSQCVCDCWSNESVQNVKLLSAMAPTVSVEQLIYDCRLMNTASSRSHKAALDLRDWLAESDSSLDPQAYVLRPDVVIEISREMIKGRTPYEQTCLALKTTVEKIQKAYDNKQLQIREQEQFWLGHLKNEIDNLPQTEDELIEEMISRDDLKGRFIPAEYGL